MHCVCVREREIVLLVCECVMVCFINVCEYKCVCERESTSVCVRERESTSEGEYKCVCVSTSVRV